MKERAEGMSWTQTIPYILGAAAFFLVPGALVLRACGIRGLAMVAGGVPVSASFMGILAILCGLLGFPWTPWVYLGAALATAAAAFGIRLLLARRWPAVSRFPAPFRFSSPTLARLERGRWGGAIVPLVFAVAIALPAMAVFYRYAHGFGGVGRISQTFDNVYHLNAIRTIIESRNGSSLTLGNLTPETRVFYPAVWHDMTALLVPMFGLSVPQAVNVSNIVIGAIVWPLSVMYLITRATGTRLLPLLAAAVVIPAFPAFPYLMVDMGVLYPTHFALALLPAALGAAVQFLGFNSPGSRFGWRAFLLLMAMAPGMLLAHPSTLLALVAFMLPLMAIRLWTLFWARGESRRARRAFWGFAAFFAVYFLGGLGAWIVVRPPNSAATWLPTRSLSRALGEVLAGTPSGLGHGLLMFALTCAGIYYLTTAQQKRWLLGIMAMGAALYMICIGLPVGPVRTFFTGNWYNDSNRLAAMLPMVSAPVIVLGTEFLLRRATGWVTGLATRRRMFSTPESDAARSAAAAGAPSASAAGAAGEAERSGAETPSSAGAGGSSRVRWADGGLIRDLLRDRRTLLSGALALLALGGIGLQLQSGAITTEQSRINHRYWVGPDSQLLSPDEGMLLQRLPSEVPADNVVIANPRNGETLAFALMGVKVLKPHVHGKVSDEAQYLLDHWQDAASDPKVCAAIREKRAYYALHFGPPYISTVNQQLPGTTFLDKAPGVVLVDSQGPAKLYKMTACG